MNQDLCLKILGDVMGWSDAQARQEYAWLRLISRVKYDGYQDFLAGKRFIESLISWLKQFERGPERDIAYAFVRDRLVYVSAGELQNLVRLTYPEHVRRRLVSEAAARCGVPLYQVWTNRDAAVTYNRLRNSTLFFGLSDGARMDIFRRANAGLVSNEQVVVSAGTDNAKWEDLLVKLRRRTNDESAGFDFVYLLDDFVGSGKTLLRVDAGEWTGKLIRFWENLKPFLTTHFHPDWTLVVHHYLASYEARRKVDERAAAIMGERVSDWFPRVEFSYSAVLSRDLPLREPQDSGFLALADKYYDPGVETEHTKVGGEGVQRGFGDCALPVVLEHNTPNNSMALLWAETVGGTDVPAMRALFRRRQRHG